MLRKLLTVCSIAAIWTVAWGVTGAAIGAIITVFQPDTGHIPSEMMPVFIGVPSAIFGLAAGLLYGVVAVVLGMEVRLGAKGRAILGALVGGSSGIVFMRVLAHSYLTVFLAVLLGASLAAGLFFAKKHSKKRLVP